MEYLFGKKDSHRVREGQSNSMRNEIAALPSDRLLNTNADDLSSYFAERFHVEVPVLLLEGMVADQRETQIDVSRDRMRYISDRSRPFLITGTQINVEIPFHGNADVFQIKPSSWDTMPPQATVQSGCLIYSMTGTDMTPDTVKQAVERWLAAVQKYLGWLAHDFTEWNQGLRATARSIIDGRREKLLADQNLLAGLGIALKPRADAPTTYSAPEVRRKVEPRMPAATPGPYKPEPVLEENEYKKILGIITSMAHVMERSPKAFHGMGEEDIRTHFLVQLNGHYEGGATGETFNYDGKTDILVRSGSRNVFVGECKVWGGPKILTETIDQVLGYLTWRDAKAAIILFNRNRISRRS